MTGKKLNHAPLKPRRKPVQSRSMATQAAILEAFVRLLQEKGYARLTIRDIAAVAGVGLGTVYEHFPSKQSIAANCIRQRFKEVGVRMLACLDTARGRPLAESIDAVLDTLIALHADRPEEWSALIYLERQISDIEAYRSLYAHFVDIWQQILQAAEAPSALISNREIAYVLHAAVYGLLYQTLLCRPHIVATPEFRAQLGALVHGYLHAAGNR